MKPISALSVATALALGLAGGAVTDVRADPVEYLRVCDGLGPGWFHVPGREYCLNPLTNDFEAPQPLGYAYPDQTALADRVDAAFASTALGLAIPQAFIEPDHHFAFAMNLGTVEGNGAVGAAGAVRINDNLTFGGGLGTEFTNGTFAGRAGFSYSW